MMVYEYCKEMNMITNIYGKSSYYAPESIYRCVNHLKAESPWSDLDFIPASFVGTSPAKYVSDNRMSEAGDMMFYGAASKKTAMIEVGRAKDTDEDKNAHFNPATIGLFHPNKMFKLLNLTGIEERKCPSIFEPNSDKKRESWLFIKNFTELISEEKHNGNSYKPTQVLTKYFQRRTNLKGIMYNSSKVKSGTKDRMCYVLFVSNRNCLDVEQQADSSKTQLIMEECEQIGFDTIGI